MSMQGGNHWHIELDDEDSPSQSHVVINPNSSSPETTTRTVITPATTSDVETKQQADENTTQKITKESTTKPFDTPKLDKPQPKTAALSDIELIKQTSAPRYAPQDNSSFLSQMFFTWMSPLMKLGASRQLQNSDLYSNWYQDSNAAVWDEFSPVWERKLKEEREAKIAHDEAKRKWEESGATGKPPKFPPLRPARLIAVYAEIYGLLFLISGFLWAVSNADQLLGPFFLDNLLSWATNKYYGIPVSDWDGYRWGVCLFCSALVASICRAHSFHQCNQIALRIRNSLISVIFRKSLKLVAKEKKDGSIVNLMAADSTKIIEFSMMLHQVWSSPIVMAIGIYQMYQQVNNASLVGLGVLFCSLPLAGVLTKRQVVAQRATSLQTDKRIGIVNEFIQGIRVVKFYAWEKPLIAVLGAQREAELSELTRLAIAKSLTFGTMAFVPLCASVAIFAVYAFTGGQMTASRVFTTVALVNVIRFPFTFLPMSINANVQILVSLGRIEAFLRSAEVDPDSVDKLDRVGVELENASFSWADEPEKDENPRLINMNLSVKEKELVSIVGPVASGKSTLLLGLLGEANRIRGTCKVGGKIAYVPQSAFIVNATMKDNILFGLPYDEERYKQVLYACALLADIEQLPNGDMTEIGERGINISGGQKQRVSLARAAYNRDVDLVLLDDPLSAVDSHVGAHIFAHCINGLLSDKTRVFVTHNLSFLSFSDKVVVLKENAKDSYTVGGCDTYENLLQNNSSFSELIEMYNKGKADMGISSSVSMNTLKTVMAKKSSAQLISSDDMKQEVQEQPPKPTTEQPVKTKEEKGKLVDTEEREEGEINWRIWLGYFLAGARPFFLLCIILVMFTFQTFTTLGDYWLSYWSSNIGSEQFYGIHNPYSKAQYIGYYAGIAGIIAIAAVIRTLSIAMLGVSVSRTLHKRLTKTVMGKSMQFFDRTPVGRIINRFTKDFYVVDIQMPLTLEFTFNTFISTIAILIVIAINIPYALIGFAVLLVVYYRVQGQYRKTSREMQRIESVTRTPIFSHFTETLGGVVSIRALRACDQYTKTNAAHVENNSKSLYLSKATGFWLRLRLDLMAAVIVALAALLGLYALSQGQINPGNFGLMLSYSLGICNMLNWSVIMLTQLEAYMNSVERIQHYSEPRDLEAWDAKDPALDIKVKESPMWPSEGRIVFDKVQMKYREDLELVLKGISIEIQPGQKVGVVGRTGSGKSSTLMTLFRMCECSGGRIVIDGVDIGQISLEALRSGLSIIPQEPVLFSGTFKYNLDPFGTHTEQEVWQALDYVQLKGVVERMPLQLSTLVADAGSNLSLGQRQLLCLARALLRNSKVICLDEATASVDAETDKVIQDIIRTKFSGSTVLTIAHRLNTILDYDRILVLDHGHVAEWDTPSVLRSKPNGIFASMLESASKTHDKKGEVVG